jgi:hypothetical protein
MEPSLGTSSFLCFLPKGEGKASGLVYLNGIHESSNIPQFSIEAIPLKLSRIKSQSNDCDLPNGAANYAYTVLARRNAYYNNTANAFQKEVSEADKGVVIQEGSVDEHGERNEKICTSNDGEPNIDSISLSEILADEEDDELAFEITEFFKSFGQQQMQLQNTLEPKLSQSTSMDGHLGSSRLSSLTCEDISDGETSLVHVDSGGNSTKGNGFDSTTSSGQLSFSGQQQFCSGHLCQASHPGSISHRSDSSTTSTRSFAFPMFVSPAQSLHNLLYNLILETIFLKLVQLRAQKYIFFWI